MGSSRGNFATNWFRPRVSRPRSQRGGIIDLASAMKDASPFAAMDEIEAMSKRMFGKPLEDLSGVQVAAIEQAANINDEQLDQFSKLKETLERPEGDHRHQAR